MNTYFPFILPFALFILFILPILRRSERRTITADIRAHSSGKFIRLSHGYTHYEVSGPEDGPVVVLIHGFSVPYYMWDQTFETLSAAGFRTIRYDLYGRGLSDRPKTIYNRELFVTQLSELLDALAIKEPVNLIATSMGGAIAAAFTANFPDRVTKVTLIDPLYQKWQIGSLGWPGIGEYLYAGFVLPNAPRQQLNDFFKPENFQEWPLRFREQMNYRGFGRALLSTLRHFMTKDPTPDYQQIRQQRKPVLLIWGSEDQVTPPQGASKLQSILEPNFFWVEQAGHVPHYEQPEIVNTYLIDFLSGSRNHQFNPQPAVIQQQQGKTELPNPTLTHLEAVATG